MGTRTHGCSFCKFTTCSPRITLLNFRACSHETPQRGCSCTAMYPRFKLPWVHLPLTTNDQLFVKSLANPSVYPLHSPASPAVILQLYIINCRYNVSLAAARVRGTLIVRCRPTARFLASSLALCCKALQRLSGNCSAAKPPLKFQKDSNCVTCQASTVPSTGRKCDNQVWIEEGTWRARARSSRSICRRVFTWGCSMT